MPISHEHRDTIVAVLVDRSSRLVAVNFTSLCSSNKKQKRDAVIKAARRFWFRWEGKIAERKLNWRELWSWELACLIFLINQQIRGFARFGTIYTI